jgi:Tol biopolymer transport system component
MASNRRMRTMVVLTALVLAATGCAWLSRASVRGVGVQANDSSAYPALSPDGRYVAFASQATNLVGFDTNGVYDIFVRDTQTETVSRVSRTAGGGQANSASFEPAISADGRYVAFTSAATNLVPGDNNGSLDIFVRDTVAGTTTRVSVASGGAQADGDSERSVISDDGRFVAFTSRAFNLVDGDSLNDLDVFVHDVVTSTTTRVSVGIGGEANNGSEHASISADGRIVAFHSAASNLVADDTNFAADVFVYDTTTGTTTRASVSDLEAQGNGLSANPDISADGRWVAFESTASNLVAGDTNGFHDVYVRDLVAGTTARVSLDHAGAEADDASYSPSISGDGRYVAFQSNANLVTTDVPFTIDVYVRDRVGGTTTMVGASSAGAQSNAESRVAVVSGDGRYVAFESVGTNLVADDTNASMDVFVRANPQPTIATVAPTSLARGGTTTVVVTGSGFIEGVVVDAGEGAAAIVTAVSPTAVTAEVTVDAAAAPGPRTLLVLLLGTGPGPGAGAADRCVHCLTVV